MQLALHRGVQLLRLLPHAKVELHDATGHLQFHVVALAFNRDEHLVENLLGELFVPLCDLLLVHLGQPVLVGQRPAHLLEGLRALAVEGVHELPVICQVPEDARLPLGEGGLELGH